MRRGQTKGGIGRQMIQRLRGHSKDFSLYSKNNAKPSEDYEQERIRFLFFQNLLVTMQRQTREDGRDLQ